MSLKPVLPFLLGTLVSVLLGCTSGPATTPSGSVSATVSPSPTAAAFNPAKLQPALMSEAQVGSLLPSAYQALRSLETDPQLPFSSAPEMGDKLAGLGVSLYFNSYQVTAAPPAGRPFAVQNTAQGFPSSANAEAAYEHCATDGRVRDSFKARPNKATSAPPGKAPSVKPAPSHPQTKPRSGTCAWDSQDLTSRQYRWADLRLTAASSAQRFAFISTRAIERCRIDHNRRVSGRFVVATYRVQEPSR